MTFSSPLGFMSEGERLALARYRLKHTIPLPNYKPYSTNIWTINNSYERPLNFRDIYEITKRNQALPLGDVAKDQANNGFSRDYQAYLDNYRWNENSWQFSIRIEISPAAQKILEITKDL